MYRPASGSPGIWPGCNTTIAQRPARSQVDEEPRRRHLQPPLCPRAQQERLRFDVVADDHGVVPARPRASAQLLQHEHGNSGGKLRRRSRRMSAAASYGRRSRARALASSSGCRLPSPSGQVDLRREVGRRDRQAGRRRAPWPGPPARTDTRRWGKNGVCSRSTRAGYRPARAAVSAGAVAAQPADQDERQDDRDANEAHGARTA